jgi:transposase-like protein
MGSDQVACPACGAAEARKHGRDRQGRQRYRCCGCRGRFTALTGTPFSGYRFPPAISALAVRWYLRYRLSYADVAELLAERGVRVDPSTVYAWVREFAPLYEDAARFSPQRRGHLERRRDLHHSRRQAGLRLPVCWLVGSSARFDIGSGYALVRVGEPLLQALVWPCGVEGGVEVGGVLAQNAPHATEEPLAGGVLPGGTVGGPQHGDAARLGHARESRLVRAVVIADEVPGLLPEGCRLTQLLGDPGGGRARSRRRCRRGGRGGP